jgi:hypothetical protein
MEILSRLKAAFSSCRNLTLKASWDLALFQVDVALNGSIDEETFNSVYATLIHPHSDFWDILLSAVIIYLRVIPNLELQSSFLDTYSDFLMNNFSGAEESVEDYIRVHSFFAQQLLTTDTLDYKAVNSIMSAIQSGIQKTTVVVTTDETNSIVSMTTRPLMEMMSSLLQTATEDLPLRDVIFRKLVSFLMQITEVIMRVSSIDCRCVVAKLLVVPLFQLLAVEAQPCTPLEDLLLSCWITLCAPLLAAGDVDTCSIVGFSVVDTAVTRTSAEGAPMNSLVLALGNHTEPHSAWDLVLKCLQHRSSLVVRKRGARMLHDLALLLSRVGGGSLGWDKDKDWCRTYLNVYQQLEGCMSMHLVSQVSSENNKFFAAGML